METSRIHVEDQSGQGKREGGAKDEKQKRAMTQESRVPVMIGCSAHQLLALLQDQF